MFRSGMAMLGKALRLAFLVGLFALSASLISEKHLLPGVAFGFFAICFSVSWINELRRGPFRSRVDRDRSCDPAMKFGPHAQDDAMYELTGNLALVASVAAAEGRVAIVASTGKEMSSDNDDDPLIDPFDPCSFGGMCPAPTGDDRF